MSLSTGRGRMVRLFSNYMMTNLLRETWTNLDPYELRLLLHERIGGPGQYDGRPNDPNTLYLPLARSSCRVALIYRDKKIVAIEAGPAFDATEWGKIGEEVEKSILAGSIKVGREYGFSSFRVTGSWRGARSGIQILPPPNHAPRSEFESAEHPFILEFPLQTSEFWPVTNHRRLRDHRNLTLLLNILLAGRTNVQPRRSQHFWANVEWDGSGHQIKWVQQYFFAKLDDIILDELSPSTSEQIEEVEPEQYYEKVGHDGLGLRVPADLDQSIFLYQQLRPAHSAKFDRALFWMDMASRQWTTSVSSSFASLVSAIESLTERGTTHRVYCEQCNKDSQHEAPGATERFRLFFEKYAAGASLRSRRTQMYELRSGILHGSELMHLDQDLALGWDPPWWNERELHEELWGLTRVGLRNWLKSPPVN